MFDELNITLIVLLFLWCFGLGAIEIEIEGADEQEAMKAIVALIDDKFGEGQ